ncbi:MAG: hypothetical protein HYZ83_07890, partial [Candidatus Omnitrophica bacterium]|nr:hypothetical protein [Candidatus Omnitrophota bacterium]
ALRLALTYRTDINLETIQTISRFYHSLSYEDLGRFDLTGDGIADNRDLELLNSYLAGEGLKKAVDFMINPAAGFAIKVGTRQYSAQETVSFLNQISGGLRVENGQLLIGSENRDSFDSPQLKGWNRILGDWIMQSGALRQNSLASAPALQLFDSANLTDFTISADVFLTGVNGGFGVDEQAAGLVFRAKDSANYYDVVINRETREVEFRKIVNGKIEVLNSQASAEIADRNYINLKVDGKGTSFKIYVNGELLFTATHTLYQTGKTGLTSQGAEAFFDNFSLSTFRAASDLVQSKSLKNDLNGDGTIDAFDEGILNQLARLSTIDLTGDGAVLPEDGNLLIALSRADVNRDGRVNGFDLSRFDLNQDGQFNLADETQLENVSYITQTLVEFNRADIDHNNRVDEADVEAIRSALRGQVDVNGDGAFSALDRSRVANVIEWLGIQYTDEVWNADKKIGLADVNGDHRVDIQDQADLSWAISMINKTVGTAAPRLVMDLDGDGRVNKTDLIALEEILDLINRGQVALPEHVELADMNRDGKVTAEDRGILDTVIKRILEDTTGFYQATLDLRRYDQNKDGKIDGSDLERFDQVSTLIQAHKTRSQDDVVRLDVSGNGLINAEDLDIASRVFRYYVNVNGEGTVTAEDVEKIGNVIRKEDLAVDAKLLKRADLDGSGAVTNLDIALFDQAWSLLAVMDRNNNGWMDNSEADEYLKLIHSYIARGINTLDVFSSYDLDGNLFINGDDIKVIRKANQSRLETIRRDEDFIHFDASKFTDLLKRAVDVNGDGIRNGQDLERIASIASYQDLITSGISQDLFSRADVDENFVVDHQDLELMTKRLSETELYDLDFDGEVDQKDVVMMQDMVNAVKAGQILSIQDYLKRDLTGDGRVTSADTEQVWNVIKGHVDLSIPKDGVIDYTKDDLTILNDLIYL